MSFIDSPGVPKSMLTHLQRPTSQQPKPLDLTPPIQLIPKRHSRHPPRHYLGSKSSRARAGSYYLPSAVPVPAQSAKRKTLPLRRVMKSFLCEKAELGHGGPSLKLASDAEGAARSRVVYSHHTALIHSQCRRGRQDQTRRESQTSLRKCDVDVRIYITLSRGG
jgi:hypothetical protein